MATDRRNYTNPSQVLGLESGESIAIDAETGGDGKRRLLTKTEVSGVAEGELSELNDEVAVFGGVDGSETADASTRQIINVDSAGRVRTDGGTAHGVADAGNPHKMGGQARQTNPTAVSDAQRVNAIMDDLGRQVMILNHVRDLVTRNSITLTSTTETTLLGAGGAGVFHDLTHLFLTNTSTTAVRVDFRDATAGTVQFSIGLAANGGAVIPMAVPFKQTTANNNWTAQLSGAVTDVRITAQAVKNI